jgi:hypothetical protein
MSAAKPKVAGREPQTGKPPDAEAIAAAVRDCPAVTRLGGGRFGEVATYLPGHRLVGVRTGPDGIEVHVIACFGVPMRDVAEQVRAAAGPLAGGMPVLVTVDDLDLDGSEKPADLDSARKRSQRQPAGQRSVKSTKTRTPRTQHQSKRRRGSASTSKE